MASVTHASSVLLLEPAQYAAALPNKGVRIQLVNNYTTRRTVGINVFAPV